MQGRAERGELIPTEPRSAQLDPLVRALCTGKIKEMTEEELEAFVEEGSGEASSSDFLDDGDLFGLGWGGE